MGGKEAKERRRLKRLAAKQGKAAAAKGEDDGGKEAKVANAAAAAATAAIAERQPKPEPIAAARKGGDANSSKAGSSITRSRRRQRSDSRKVPRPGEGGYLTPTQLRNARKRRARQQSSRTAAAADAAAAAKGAGGDSSNKRRRTEQKQKPKQRQQQQRQQHHQQQDPSLRFVLNPRGAPVVQAARKYFAPKLLLDDSDSSTPTNHNKFRVHLDTSRTEGWRTVSKLAVRPDPADGGRAVIGLFLPQTHEIVSVPDCRAHHPSINAAVKCLTRICNESSGGIVPYDEGTGTGYLRYVALGVERGSGRIQLTLVWNSSPYQEESTSTSDDEGKIMLEKLIREIRRASCGFDGDSRRKKRRRGRKKKEGDDGDGGNDSNKSEPTKPTPAAPQFHLHSLWVHYNSTWRHSNAIFDVAAPTSSWQHVCGPDYVEETLCLPGQSHPIALRFPPNVFRQANIDAFTGIVSAIRRRLERYSKERDGSDDNDDGSNSPLATCLELYGGVGTIGLNVADLVFSLISSDENRNNAACFRGAADASLPGDAKTRVSYKSKNATDMVRDGRLDHAEVLIVDPPRKGFDEAVLSALTDVKEGQGPKLIVYVSCGFDAFQRDCDAMLESGKWKLDHAEGHLLFPGSDAIETLAYFVRK